MKNYNKNKPPIKNKLYQIKTFLKPNIKKSNKIILQITNPNNINKLNFN